MKDAFPGPPDPEERRRADRLLEAALELPPAERAAFVERECPPGPRRELLERLLAGALDEGAATPFRGFFLPAGDGASLAPGTLLGPYRIVAELGRGGMAAVHLAERADGLFEQQVAIKVMARSAGDGLAERRFEQERRILASLEHPNIARILDGGRTAGGRPYFIMELVPGLPIDRYCDREKLGLEQRLRLFAAVAGAVAAAHRRLVVHRDIKPSNILVTADGVPKLLDFGIAKLLAEEPRDEGAGAATWVMTPDYASPEQWAGEPVTTASDTYQLGLLLFELLTGARPFAAASASGPAALAASRAAPPKPSAAVAGLAAEAAAERAAARGIDRPAAWRQRLRGDLDTLTAKAMSREPERRYASASHLADDVERWLAGRPLAARPDSLLYRGRKFAGRHRWAVAATALFLLLLGGLSAYYAWRLREERDAARREAEKARQVSEFLAGLFRAADPFAGQGSPELSARELLDRGAGRLEKELADQPAVQAALFHTLGGAYRGLGQVEPARRFFERAIELRTRTGGPLEADTLESRRQLAKIDGMTGRLDEARAADREVLALYEQLYGPRDPRVAQVLAHLAVLTGRRGGAGAGELAAAEEEGRRAVAILAAARPPQPLELAEAHASLAFLLRRSDRFAEAAEENGQAAELLRAGGAAAPQIAGVLVNRAFELTRLERPREARAAYAEALALLASSLDPGHPQVALLRINLAHFEIGQGRHEEALRLLAESLVHLEQAVGKKHPSIGVAHSYRSYAYFELGRMPEALAAAEQAREAMLANFPPHSAELIELDLDTADILERLGRPAEARALTAAAAARAEEHLPPGHPILALARRALAAL